MEEPSQNKAENLAEKKESDNESDDGQLQGSSSHPDDEKEIVELNPFENGACADVGVRNGITSLSSDHFPFGEESMREFKSDSRTHRLNHSNSEQKDPFVARRDAACEVVEIDDIEFHRTVAMQFDGAELDRAVEFEKIQDEVENRSKKLQQGQSHIGEMKIVRKKHTPFLNVQIKKPKKKLHSLFGAKVSCTCDCEVYDEVRVAVWILAFLAVVTATVVFLVDLSTDLSTLIANNFQEQYIAIIIAGV